MDDPFTLVRKRLEALGHYQLLDTAPEADFDSVTARACEICDTPMATVTLLDDKRQWFKSKVGLGDSETPIEHAFCARAIEKPDELLIVEDAHTHRIFRTNPFVVGAPHIRFYAGAPLVTPEGVPVGTVCVIDRRPRRLSRTKRAALRTLARETVAHMEVRRLRYALGKARETTEMLEVSEAYFRHLTEYALDLTTILDANGKILFESRSIKRELGHEPAHYRGRNAFDFVHPDDCPEVLRHFQSALENHGNTPTIRFRFLHADGSYRLLEGSGNNLLDDPAVRGIVFNSRDITEKARLQDTLEKARQEKEDTIARLTGGVAHDFNNILTAVQGMSELTMMRLSPASLEAGYLGEIQAAARRAAGLTQQLLAFSRRTVLQPRSLELAGWLAAIKPRLDGVLGERIELTVAASGELCVWEDPTQLEQVIVQLAANAREAMPAGGRFTIEAAPVTLGPSERPADGREGEVSYVQLSLADQGTGMDEETLARIFEPFFTTKTVGYHPGLGLCMCRGIVEQSGGHLTVRSHAGRGTVFHLYLPATERVEEELPPSPPPAATFSDVPTILFVDDEPMLREIGETILLEGGFRVIVAEDGPDALARLSELGAASLDLLISDVIMPGMTGVQLAAEVTRQRPGTRVLLCSGYTRDALHQSGGIPPGVSFLPKPYTLSSLLDRVAELLAVPHA